MIVGSGSLRLFLLRFDFFRRNLKNSGHLKGQEKMLYLSNQIYPKGRKGLHMAKKYDVIVVGAGNGGLTAAATTAKAGLSTLVLEKHNLPGGCATSFRRGRFEFEPSLHELCSVGSKEAPDMVYDIFDGLDADVDWRYERNMFRAIVKGDEGYDVTLSAENGVEDFCDCMEKLVPGCRESVHMIFELAELNAQATDYIYAKKGNPNSLVMITKYADFMRCSSHTTDEVMDALGVPKKAQDIIKTYWCYLGVPTDDLSAMHFFKMVNDYVKCGAAMPAMRSHELSLSLADVITKNGGEIWYNHEVTEFLYDDDGKMTGVVANGEELYAKEIISNVIADNVYNMSPEGKIPERQLKLSNARNYGISMATVYLGLDCSMEELGVKDYTVFVMTDRSTRKQFEDRKDGSLYIVNCLNKVIPDSSPEGTCTLFITIPMMGYDLPEDLTPDKYKKFKNDIARRYIEDYEKTMGISIMPHIEEIEIATPVTFARYLGTPEGEVYGYASNMWDNIMTRIQNEAKDTGIEHLNYVGGHSIRGDGYSCAYYTGDSVGKRVVRKLKGGSGQ